MSVQVCEPSPTCVICLSSDGPFQTLHHFGTDKKSSHAFHQQCLTDFVAQKMLEQLNIPRFQGTIQCPICREAVTVSFSRELQERFSAEESYRGTLMNAAIQVGTLRGRELGQHIGNHLGRLHGVGAGLSSGIFAAALVPSFFTAPLLGSVLACVIGVPLGILGSNLGARLTIRSEALLTGIELQSSLSFSSSSPSEIYQTIIFQGVANGLPQETLNTSMRRGAASSFKNALLTALLVSTATTGLIRTWRYLFQRR